MAENLTRSLLQSKIETDLTDAQIHIVSDVLNNKFDVDTKVIERIQLEAGPKEVIKIHHPDRSRPLYADPTGEYSIEPGIKTHGEPPEGKAKNPEGEDSYGIR
jgi:hypothetical protein